MFSSFSSFLSFIAGSKVVVVVVVVVIAIARSLSTTVVSSLILWIQNNFLFFGYQWHRAPAMCSTQCSVKDWLSESTKISTTPSIYYYFVRVFYFHIIFYYYGLNWMKWNVMLCYVTFGFSLFTVRLYAMSTSIEYSMNSTVHNAQCIVSWSITLRVHLYYSEREK